MKLKKLPLFVIAFLFLLPIPTFASSIKVYFSLVDDPGEAIIKQLNKAEESIDIAMYYFADRDLANTVIDAYNRGVKVRVYLDKDQRQAKYSKSRYLAKHNISIRYSNNPYLIHNKFCVIDNEVVITGSYNWIASAAKRNNNENLLIIKDAYVANKYEEEFNRLWSRYYLSEEVAPPQQIRPTKQPQTEKIVYMTKTAKKYHRANCKYLRKSKIPITLSEAIKRGYTPCSVCKPDPPVELNNKSNLVIPLKEKILIKKPTVIIPNLKVESISNSWGQISLDTTTVNTEILVNDPNFYLIPIKASCDIYLNDIKMVSGIGKDLEITRSASGSLIRFTSTIDNENVIKWWVSHIKNKEKTKVRVEGKLIISLDQVDIIYPFSQNYEFKTHILRDLNKKNLATIRPYNFKIRSLESRWGKVTLSTTEIKHKFTIENIGILPGQPITDVDYVLVFNGIQMTRGRIGLPLLILPGQRRSAKFTLKIPNRNIIKWWVSHIKNGEKTKYYFQYRFWIKPFIKSRWQKTYGTFKTDIFSNTKNT